MTQNYAEDGKAAATQEREIQAEIDAKEQGLKGKKKDEAPPQAGARRRRLAGRARAAGGCCQGDTLGRNRRRRACRGGRNVPEPAEIPEIGTKSFLAQLWKNRNPGAEPRVCLT